MKSRQENEAAYYTIRMAPDLREELQAIADRNDRTLAAEIRRALRMHIDRQEENHA